MEHLLLHCRHFEELREETLWADGKRVTDLRELLDNPERAAMTTLFLTRTGRLFNFRKYGQINGH